MIELGIELLELIKNDNYDVDDLKKILDPTGSFISNDKFMVYVNEIVDAILDDRDGDNRITFNDIKLIGEDLSIIASIIKGLLLIMNSIPTLKLKYDTGATEELLFKILVYIFLVVIPKEANLKWTVENKTELIKITLLIYETIKSTQIVKDLMAKVVKWVDKTSGVIVTWLKKNSCRHNSDKDEVIQEHLPQIKAKIRMNMLKMKQINKLENRVAEFETDDED